MTGESVTDTLGMPAISTSRVAFGARVPPAPETSWLAKTPPTRDLTPDSKADGTERASSSYVDGVGLPLSNTAQ
eukprot:scaffold647902_cov48-Prasinocladus_malaysianus.AAC.1